MNIENLLLEIIENKDKNNLKETIEQNRKNIDILKNIDFILSANYISEKIYDYILETSLINKNFNITFSTSREDQSYYVCVSTTNQTIDQSEHLESMCFIFNNNIPNDFLQILYYNNYTCNLICENKTINKKTITNSLIHSGLSTKDELMYENLLLNAKINKTNKENTENIKHRKKQKI